MGTDSESQVPQGIDTLQFDDRGLIPAVVQDWRDGTVLMVGCMNRESLQLTMATGDVHFWSRSRKQLWKKGETSGHLLHMKQLFVDCDHDTILVKAEPVGPTCHTGSQSCFFSEYTEQGVMENRTADHVQGGILERLYEMVIERKITPREGSYVSSLLQGGIDRILKKVAEESGEVLLAMKNEKREEIVYEVSDLLFHTIVALGNAGVPMAEIHEELGKRFGQSGLKKQSGEVSHE